VVVVANGKITAVGPAATTPIPADAERIDAAGKVIMRERKIGDGSELCLEATSVIRHGFPRSRVGLAWEPLFIQARES